MNKIILLLISFFININANIIELSPLSAIIKDKNIKNAIVTINPKNNKEKPFTYKTTNTTISKYGGIPIFGLYEDFNNKIDIEYQLNNKTKKDTYFLQTKKVANKKIKILSNDEKFDNRLYLVIDEDSAFMIDIMGNIRWFANIDKTSFVEKPNSKLFIINNKAIDIINGKIFTINTKDSTRILGINDNIFTIDKSIITLVNKDNKIIQKWTFPFEINTFNNISSLDYSDTLLVSYNDSIIKLDKRSNIEWIFGGSDNKFKLIDATGSKIICNNCNLKNIENVQKIDFLSIKDRIYIITFDNSIEAKAIIYKLDENLLTNEILWEYNIIDKVLKGMALYKDDFHSIFINYKDMDKNLHILEFIWGETMPTINIKIDNAILAMPFNINDFLK